MKDFLLNMPFCKQVNTSHENYEYINNQYHIIYYQKYYIITLYKYIIKRHVPSPNRHLMSDRCTSHVQNH